jgi:adenylate cyclase
MIRGLIERNRIRDIFGRYVSREIREAILMNKVSMKGEKKDVTILFMDIRNFTDLSEKMRPEELIDFLNRYFSYMVDAIIKRGGVIDKFIGDAIMAIFGAPIAHDDDPLRAVLCAADLIKQLEQFNQENVRLGQQPIFIGIGIHTGEVVAGNIGSSERMEYTVVGDTVNVASRIESLTKKYHTGIIISDTTYKKVMNREDLKLRELDSVRVKGRSRPIVLYECYAVDNSSNIALKDRSLTEYMQGITFYKLRQFKEAQSSFESVLRIYPDDSIAKMYIERCMYFSMNPPPEDWDGVFSFSEK